jgi:hypothetical protein
LSCQLGCEDSQEEERERGGGRGRINLEGD